MLLPVVLLLTVGLLEAFRYQLYRQVAAVRQRVERLQAEADALAVKARELAPIKPRVERAVRGVLDPADGNLWYQQLAELLMATRAAGVDLTVLNAGNQGRVGPFNTQTLSLQVHGRPDQILQFMREVEGARPLIRVVAWRFQPVGQGAPAGAPGGPTQAEDGAVPGQFTVLYYHK